MIAINILIVKLVLLGELWASPMQALERLVIISLIN